MTQRKRERAEGATVTARFCGPSLFEHVRERRERKERENKREGERQRERERERERERVSPLRL